MHSTSKDNFFYIQRQKITFTFNGKGWLLFTFQVHLKEIVTHFLAESMFNYMQHLDKDLFILTWLRVCSNLRIYRTLLLLYLCYIMILDRKYLYSINNYKGLATLVLDIMTVDRYINSLHICHTQH